MLCREFADGENSNGLADRRAATPDSCPSPPTPQHGTGHGVKNTVHIPEAAKTAGKRAERAAKLYDRWLKKQPAPQPVKPETK